MLRIISCIVLMLFSTFAWSQSALDQLDAWMSSVNQLQARFDQVIRSKDGSILQRSSGTLMIRRPNQFRWEVQKPIQQIIFANGNELAIYDPDLQQIILKQLNRVASDAPALLLSRSFKQFSNEFSVSMKSISPTEVHFILAPRDSSATQQFDRVILIFKNKIISGMRLLDQYNHQTNIQFHDVRLNQGLPKNAFQHPQNPDIDVVDARKKN